MDGGAKPCMGKQVRSRSLHFAALHYAFNSDARR